MNIEEYTVFCFDSLQAFTRALFEEVLNINIMKCCMKIGCWRLVPAGKRAHGLECYKAY